MMQIKIEINGVLIYFVDVVNTGRRKRLNDSGIIVDDEYDVSLNRDTRNAVKIEHDKDDGALRLAEIALGKLT